jgi:hypothetical protein
MSILPYQISLTRSPQKEGMKLAKKVYLGNGQLSPKQLKILTGNSKRDFCSFENQQVLKNIKRKYAEREEPAPTSLPRQTDFDIELAQISFVPDARKLTPFKDDPHREQP